MKSLIVGLLAGLMFVVGALICFATLIALFDPAGTEIIVKNYPAKLRNLPWYGYLIPFSVGFLFFILFFILVRISSKKQ